MAGKVSRATKNPEVFKTFNDGKALYDGNDMTYTRLADFLVAGRYERRFPKMFESRPYSCDSRAGAAGVPWQFN
ncbi:hypothetical protein ETB97_012096 [Aspergillus alliaceus]|uniref:Uncharacterized protein n=1 Tax=Petromyces alliaceus TaxID=209559 RepID=A0A8H6E798_PETAA|nr:hypothetical protein ETB97_012096 [Aspergillus burnettii]